MRRNLFFIAFLFLATALQAQTIFLPAVKIEFEQTVYNRQLMKEMYPDQYDRIKDRVPEKTLTYFDFIGDTTKSVFKPGKENTETDVVYNDYRNGTFISKKAVFEETFLVEDSLAKINWKITADTRTIAGFECRKAVGILRDSIAVFAFYTDEILIPGGPESIQGLPGMILGIGVPRLHATWFATKIEASGFNMSSVVPATKGKKTNYGGMIQFIEKGLKNWGKNGRNIMLGFAI